MHRIIAKKVTINPTTRRPDMVWISYFNKDGMEIRTELMPGRLFPDDLKDGDEVTFIQKSKVA